VRKVFQPGDRRKGSRIRPFSHLRLLNTFDQPADPAAQPIISPGKPGGNQKREDRKKNRVIHWALGVKRGM